MMQQHVEFYAIIVAAGSGTRMGTAVPKPLLPLADGVPMVVRTLEPFLAMSAINQIYLIIPADMAVVFDKGLAQLTAADRTRITYVVGGGTRRESVRNGLREIETSVVASENCFVLVHDAARPFITQDAIGACMTAVRERMAVSLGVPVVDSIKEVDGTCRVSRSVPRENLWNVQTPQAFHLPLLLQAHARGDDSATDDAMLVEAIHDVWMVLGDASNFKVTSPADLAYARYCYANETGSSSPS